MILGNRSTRACSFCDVEYLKPESVDWEEPQRLAESIKMLKLMHAVITSVVRDDLVDGGAEFWAYTMKKVKELNPETTMEVFIPDFNRKYEVYDLIINEKPEVISHNIETDCRLTPSIRSMARYQRSLDVLKYISRSGIITKSGFMLGLEEQFDEVEATMDNIFEAGVKVLTIGQYLSPSENHAQVIEYVHPDLFKEFQMLGIKKGVKIVESGP